MKGKKPDHWPLLPPQHWSLLGSQPGVSWPVLSFGHTRQWTTRDDPQPLGGKNKHRLKTLSSQRTWNHWSWQQEAITYIELKEQLSLLRGDFIVCPKCQVMNLSAFSEVHALNGRHKDEFNTPFRAVTIRNFWRRLNVRKIIAIDNYTVYFIFYKHSIMSFNHKHSLLDT